MPNILFVTPYVPSPVRIRSYRFIRELARLGHRVTLACLVQPAWEASYLDEVREYCAEVDPVIIGRREPYVRIAASIPTPVPLSVAYCRSKEFACLVNQLAFRGDFDLIHTEFIRAAQFTAGITHLPKVYDAVDSLSLAYRRSLSAPQVSAKQRLISLWEWLKLRGYERSMTGRFDKVLVSSPVDRQSLEIDGRQVTVIPNGVDLDYFVFNNANRADEAIVFLGKMSYYVNVASVLWFYRQVLPLIRLKHPGVKFIIVGRDPVPEILSLAADPNVQVTGTVPDVRPYLAQATLEICPMVTGSGIQNKILEAMAVGTPVISTQYSFQGLLAEAGRDIIVAEGVHAFAGAVLDLLEQPALRESIARNGRSYVEQHHDWQSIGNGLNQLYQDVLHSVTDHGKE